MAFGQPVPSEIRPPLTPVVRTLTLDSFRPHTLDEAVSGGAVDHTQLAPGRFLGQLVHADLAGCVLDYGVYNLPLLACGGMPGDRVVLGFVGSDAADGNLNGTVVRDAALVALAEGSELDYRMAARTRWMGFQIDRTTLTQLGVALGTAASSFPPLEPAKREQIARLVADAVGLLRGIEAEDPAILHPGNAACALREVLTATLASALPTNDELVLRTAGPAPRRLRILQRVREYFEAHLSEPIRVTQLCREVGASIKSLERAFLEAYGTNPKQLLTLMRLARARRLLLATRAGETTVAEVATDCGFFHLGRFSKSYSTLYGELPSATRPS